MASDPNPEFCCDCRMPHSPATRHRRFRRRIRSLWRRLRRR